MGPTGSKSDPKNDEQNVKIPSRAPLGRRCGPGVTFSGFWLHFGTMFAQISEAPSVHQTSKIPPKWTPSVTGCLFIPTLFYSLGSLSLESLESWQSARS